MVKRGPPLGTVILFARTARVGRGKRRLAKDIGNIGAWSFYRWALARSVRLVAREAGWRGVIMLDPGNEVTRPGFPLLNGPQAALLRLPQQGRSLGERMVRALGNAPPGPVVLIGADIQGVSAPILRRALMACRRSELVFGPASDGGFWLIGCKRRLSPRMFDHIIWSTSHSLCGSAL
ncbi:MAG: TIGR04282 family arsenosugar biosynthesis glycosyltransferase [Alphaproteobacteria bacterium]